MKRVLIISRCFNDLELIWTAKDENSIISTSFCQQKRQELHHA